MWLRIRSTKLAASVKAELWIQVLRVHLNHNQTWNGISSCFQIQNCSGSGLSVVVFFPPKLKLFLHVLWLIIRLFDTYLAACSSQPKPVILVSLPLSPCWVVPWHISHLNLTAQLGACYISHFQCRPKYCLYVTYFAMLVPHTVANSFGYCCSSHHQHHPDLCLNMTYLSTPLPHGENMVIVWVISSAAVFCALAWPTCHTSTSTANSVIILQANVT